jgi:hypothetical protein
MKVRGAPLTPGLLPYTKGDKGVNWYFSEIGLRVATHRGADAGGA